MGGDENQSFFCVGLEYSSYCLKDFCFIGFPFPSLLAREGRLLAGGREGLFDYPNWHLQIASFFSSKCVIYETPDKGENSLL